MIECRGFRITMFKFWSFCNELNAREMISFFDLRSWRDSVANCIVNEKSPKKLQLIGKWQLRYVPESDCMATTAVFCRLRQPVPFY